jgi:hypothetical protein
VNGLPRPGDDHLAGQGTELALGALTGRERARAVEHLQHCAPCRARVSAAAATEDDLLRLLPGMQPPAGFSGRTAQRLQQAGKAGKAGKHRARPRPSWRAWPRAHRVLAAAVAVVVVAGGLAGWALSPGSPPAGPTANAASPTLRSAALVTPAHQVIGMVYLHWNGPIWMFVTVDTGTANISVTCQLTIRSGRLITVGSFKVTGGDGYWGNPAPARPAAITGARLLSANGAVLATARF